MNRIRTFAILLAALAAPALASADPVRITSGGFSATGLTSVSPIRLEGHGFRLSGGVGLGIFSVWDCQFAECRAGETVSLRAFWSGLDLISTVWLDDVRYDNVGSAASPDAAVADFSGDFMLPPLTAQPQIVTPFLFTGQFSFFDPDTATGGRIDLVGRGFVTVSLQPGPAEDTWQIGSVDYRFDDEDALATPEPATLLLTASGVVLLARRRRQNRGVRR